MNQWSGARSPRWRFMLLDDNDIALGLLDGVTGGDGKVVAQSRLGGSASLEIDERGHAIDWMRHRVQAIYDPGIPGAAPWAFGTYLFTSPVEKHSAFGVSYTVGLLTKLSVIDEDTVDGRFSVPAGTPIIETVVSLIQSTGETRIAVTDSAATLSSDYVSEPSASKLDVINDLLGMAGYWSLWCDGSGQFRVEPYVRPEDRPIAFSFEHGQASVHFPEWEREQNQSVVPNRYVVVGNGDETSPPLIGLAENHNPASPYSYQARGRWITGREEGFDGATQAVCDARAEQRLRDAMSPVSRMTATHAMLPLEQNQLVEFIAEDGIRRLATIQSMSADFRPLTDCGAEWREVVPV